MSDCFFCGHEEPEPDYWRFDNDNSVINRFWRLACGILGHKRERKNYHKKTWVACGRCGEHLSGDELSCDEMMGYSLGKYTGAMTQALLAPNPFYKWLRNRASS